MLPYCNYNGIGLIPWAPLAAGNLCRPLGIDTVRSDVNKNGPMRMQFSDADKAIISRVEELSKKHGTTMAKVALAWTQSKCSSPIIGMSSVKRIEDNILGDFTLGEEDIKYLEEP